jgi:hypothetical protein
MLEGSRSLKDATRRRESSRTIDGFGIVVGFYI